MSYTKDTSINLAKKFYLPVESKITKEYSYKEIDNYWIKYNEKIIPLNIVQIAQKHIIK